MSRKVEACPTCGERYTKRFFLKRALRKEIRSREHFEAEMLRGRGELKALTQQYAELADMHRKALGVLRAQAQKEADDH